ncbi:MAG: serine hydrolase domain-containing protein [Marinirhabdus sp.]|nr:serine hydrolase domain-containing protein [Marinirhabdus sp.]
MKFQIILLAFLFLGCNTTQEKQIAQSENPEAHMAELADVYFSKLTGLEDFNGVVLLKKNDEIILNKAYTMSSDTTSTLFITKNSQFDLRSLAKLFAKISIIDLEAEGKLLREDTLSKYLPDFPNAKTITIEQLMSNTSGLPRTFEESDRPYIELGREDVLELAATSKLEFEPGTEERYSNVGFQLIYYTIGEATGTSFESYINQHCFEPLGMRNTGSHFFTGKDRKTQYAFGHYRSNDKTIVCECVLPSDDMQMGNLFSTAHDMNKFMSQLDKQTYADLIHDGSISHAGGTRGKRAYVERNFDDDYSIIFLANYDDIPFEKIVADMQRIVKGDSIVLPKAVLRKSTEIPSEVLKQYEGTYDLIDAGHIILTIKFENDSLYVYQKGKNNGVIYPESERVFFGDKTSEESIEFIKNDNGQFDMLIDFQGVQWKGTRLQNNKGADKAVEKN